MPQTARNAYPIVFSHAYATGSPEFWFKTGNFIFVASGAVAYQVHGDVVGRQSKVFRDLLELNEIPRPDSEQTVDGCPVVHITDSPDEFNTFLSFLYDGFEYVVPFVVVRLSC